MNQQQPLLEGPSELDLREAQSFEKSLENNIQKMFTNYRVLLKKHSQLLEMNKESIGQHEDIQIETASRNIVSLLNSICE